MLSKYNPMSKEFQIEMKIFGLTDNQYIQKLREEGKLPNPSDIDRGKNERTHENTGCDNHCKYQKSLLLGKGYSYTEYKNCLTIDKGYENQADYFLLIGINNRIRLDIIRLWLFGKEDIIRGKELYRRKILTVVNKPKKLLEFKKYEVTEIMKALKEDINLLV